MICKVRVLVVLVAVTVASGAMASDGEIKFEGELRAGTCKVSVNGDETVKLPSLSTGALTKSGQVAGQTGFNIQLSECTDTLKTAAVFFETGATVDPRTGNLKNSGDAKNVQLQLVDATTGRAIKAGDISQTTSTSPIKIEGSAADLPYAVQYFAEGATTAGTVISNVTYSINYH